MPVSTKQLTICDFSSDFEKFFNQNQTNLLTLLDKFIDISSYIPHSFYKSYYRQFGRDRKYSLESMISFFILKNILCISSIDTMINILSLSSELRSYCGFFKIPHKSQFSRFKSEFLDDINRRNQEAHSSYFHWWRADCLWRAVWWTQCADYKWSWNEWRWDAGQLPIAEPHWGLFQSDEKHLRRKADLRLDRASY